VVQNQKLQPRFKKNVQFGCSLTLAGYGYPYVQIHGPHLPVQISEQLDCDVWWNEVAADNKGQLYVTGHRIADVVALASNLEEAVNKAYDNIRKIRCLSSYYRTDIGQSLWPPGSD
jgi:phosphoribosylamine-glycine ligase